MKRHVDRASVPELDRILRHTFPVLDDGFIRPIDYMGSDQSIVEAARVSYGKGTRRLREDTGLIRYLMRHHHTTPFEMCEIKLHVRVPMDCWRQWIRHRTANVNEYSTRYSIAIDSMQKTEPSQWRNQSRTNKQGSGEFLEDEIGKLLSEKETSLHAHVRAAYDERIKLNVAREQARKDLPLSTYTEAYWKIDLHNLFHFLELRMNSHAQHEIRSYANVIGNDIVAIWCPIAWNAFKDYRLKAISLSEIEINILRYFLEGKPQEAKKYLFSLGLLSSESDKIKRGREVIEMEAKLTKLGIELDWENY